MTTVPDTAQTIEPASEQPLRLAMTTQRVTTDRLDGAWWPYSRDATLELPSLLDAIAQRFGRTRVVLLNPATWLASPEWLLWGTRRARVCWYQRQDPSIAILLGDYDKRIDLLVIPPNTESRPALSAIEAASTDGNTLTASDTLRAAHELTSVGSGAVPRVS
jgi:hypothetical protein